MTDVGRIWSPEQLKRINDDPALLSLLYDLNLLPEVVLAHIRHATGDAVKVERKECLKIVREVYPADGVEGCGCSAEIAKRIRRRGRKS